MKNSDNPMTSQALPLTTITATLETIIAYIEILERYKIKALKAEEENINLWSQVYDLSFRIWNIEIYPRLRALGLRFEWSDPDASEKKDVIALIEALSDFKFKLKILLVEE